MPDQATRRGPSGAACGLLESRIRTCAGREPAAPSVCSSRRPSRPRWPSAGAKRRARRVGLAKRIPMQALGRTATAARASTSSTWSKRPFRASSRGLRRSSEASDAAFGTRPRTMRDLVSLSLEPPLIADTPVRGARPCKERLARIMFALAGRLGGSSWFGNIDFSALHSSQAIAVGGQLPRITSQSRHRLCGCPTFPVARRRAPARIGRAAPSVAGRSALREWPAASLPAGRARWRRPDRQRRYAGSGGLR